MNIMSLFFALASIASSNDFAEAHMQSGAILETPSNTRSSMVSEDYAEIGWNTIASAEMYKIQIRKSGATTTLVLEDKTVWASFYFRVAEPSAIYEYRLASISGGRQSAWSGWTTLNSRQAVTSSN